MDLMGYCAGEIARLRQLEADEFATLRRLAAEVRATQERLMAIRGGLNAYQDVIAQIEKERD